MLTLNPCRFLATILALLATLLISAPQHASAATTYTDSAHGNSGSGVTKPATATAPNDYNTGNCAHCHDQHASREGDEPTPPAASGPSGYMLFADLAGNALCNECHDGTPTSNISDQISKTSGHDPLSPIFSGSTAGNFPAGYQDDGLNCSKCHNSHVAQTGSHNEATDGNTKKGPLLSVQGVKDDGSWTTGIPVAGAGDEDLGSTGFGGFPIALVDTITKEYELCFACHAGQLNADLQLDVAVQFNPNNASVHPIVTKIAWNNSHLKSNFATAMKDPWNVAGAVDQAMHCSDCHGSDNSVVDPKGPHGSNNKFMLKFGGSGINGDLDILCKDCHNVEAATGGTSHWVSENVEPGGLTAGNDHDLPAHQWPTNTLGCIACHGGPTENLLLKSSIHGSNYLWPDYSANPGLLSYAFLSGSGTDPEGITQNYSIGTARYCAADCHNAPGNTSGYKYAPIP